MRFDADVAVIGVLINVWIFAIVNGITLVAAVPRVDMRGPAPSCQ